MKKLIYLLCLPAMFISLLPLSTIAQKTWTGMVSSDWSDGDNWSPVGVPSGESHILIPDVHDTLDNPIATGLQIDIGMGDSLTIESGGFLRIDADSMNIDGLNNKGKVFNYGRLQIVDALGDGIQNEKDTIFNFEGGIMQIGSSSRAFYEADGGVFINEGSLSITGDSAVVTNSIFLANVGDPYGFYNAQCASISVISNSSILDNASLGVNDGILIENSSTLSTFGENNGIVQNLNGGTILISTNNGLLTTNSDPVINFVLDTMDSGPGSLRWVLECANSGELVQFNSGTDGRKISLTSGEIEVDGTVRLRGNGREETLIDGHLSNTDRLFLVNAGGTLELTALSIQNGGGSGFGSDGGGIKVLGNLKAIWSRFLGNSTTSNGGAISCDGDGNASMVNCIFTENHASNDGAVVWHDGNAVRIHQSLVYRNTSNAGGSEGSCFVSNLATMDVRNCTVALNSGEKIGNNEDSLFIANNIFAWNNVETGFDNSSTFSPYFNLVYNPLASSEGITPGSDGNISGDPLFTDTLNNDFHMLAGSAALDSGSNALIPVDYCDVNFNGDDEEQLQLDFELNDRIKYDSVDLGVYEICYSGLVVLNNNNDGVNSLRDVISCSNPGDTITFSPVTDNTLFKLEEASVVIPRSLYIFGNGPDKTIVDGSLDTFNLFATFTLNNVEIRNMTFQNGGGGESLFGGGAIGNVAPLTVDNCHFINNSSNDFGGAIGSSVAPIRVLNSVFEGNSSDVGGAIANSDTAWIENCLFYNNSATNAGAIECITVPIITDPPHLDVINCTFVDNSASSQGGAIRGSRFGGFFGDRASISIYNSIFNSNSASSGPNIYVSALSSYIDEAKSNFIDNVSGSTISLNSNGNINLDPQFTDPGSDDYTLGPLSPGINFGKNSYVTTSLDAGGNQRIQGIRVDRGAFESDNMTNCQTYVIVDLDTVDSDSFWSIGVFEVTGTVGVDEKVSLVGKYGVDLNIGFETSPGSEVTIGIGDCEEPVVFASRISAEQLEEILKENEISKDELSKKIPINKLKKKK